MQASLFRSREDRGAQFIAPAANKPKHSEEMGKPPMVQQKATNTEYQREALRYIIDIGSSLRLPMDIDRLLQRVSEAACKALGFRYSVLYLAEDSVRFRACAFSGTGMEEEAYLHQHPVPANIVNQLTSEEYRISDSYFIPAEAPLWEDGYVVSFFVVMDETSQLEPQLTRQGVPAQSQWQAEDMLIVPLMGSDNTLLGFLTPDAPLDGRRPTVETMELLELFANQAAVVIEGARLYEEARRVGEERAALIEIGRALSEPQAQRDLQAVYQTIYEQVRRVMPTDAFLVSRYFAKENRMFIDYLIDEEVLYPPQEYETFKVQMRNLLFEEKVGYIFSTALEYDSFINKDEPDAAEDLIGNPHPSESLLFVPIRYGDEVLGLLSAQSYQPHAYTRRHLELLREIGVQAGIAIVNARLNVELRKALQQAQESERLKNHFLMTASHELRTPLTAVQGYLELLGNFYDTLDDEAKLRFIGNARRACEELVLLLGNVMDTSRIDQEQVPLNLASVQLINSVQLILEILEPTIAREERPVQVSIADTIQVWVDELRLRQILLNLVGNALKYTDAPTAIALSAERIEQHALNQRLAGVKQPALEHEARDFAIVAVRDWGPGIPAEDQQRLFTKFMRLESALNSIQRGAGLGLYLCRQLTEVMGGRIWVESAGIAGEGSTFFVALPLA